MMLYIKTSSEPGSAKDSNPDVMEEIVESHDISIMKIRLEKALV